VTNNYTWNRLWTFRRDRGHVYYQGLRFLVVSLLALGANLLLLHALVDLGVGKIAAQAIAIVLVTPLNFVGNKLWSFAPRNSRE
jgi:dolichol-phosphate mannosyltransferase